MSKLIFILDNLKIGGIQRLALDEAYWARQHGYGVTLISLEEIPSINICSIENEFFEQNKIQIISLGGKKLKKLKKLKKFLSKQEDILGIICHSPSAAFLVRVACLWRKPAKILLYIHQLIELSDKKQRYKRLILSLFSDSIAVSSNQFKLSIESFLQAKFYRKILRRNIVFDRMGVYLPRIDHNQKFATKICDGKAPHSIFLSRFTAWKGFDTYEKVIEIVVNVFNGHSIVITDSNKFFEDRNRLNTPDRLHIYIQESPTSFKYGTGTVHIYPSNYGENVQYPQSIGMNVLELLAIGIPSLISKEGFESWPEFKDNKMLKTCAWDNLEEIKTKFEELLFAESSITDNELEIIRSIISIESHMKRLIAQCKN